MEREQLKAVLEALIFVAEEPISAAALGAVLAPEGVATAAVRPLIDELMEEYRAVPARGIEIREIAGGYQFRTKPDTAPWIQRLNVPRPVRLSQPALEALAIVAYRQPIVRAEIEEIRGVDCGGVLKTLLERNLIRIVGKRDEPGTPLLYGTTQEFLSTFNLNRLDELPTLKEYQALQEQSAAGAAEGAGVGAEPTSAEQEAMLGKVQPIDPQRHVELDAEDQVLAKELEEQIRALRHLESNIFPPPRESFAAVEQTEANISTDEATAVITETEGERESEPALPQ
ncbi:MAG: SMC-Scp complex subunit ScpB [Deltaproteobacteria bacterium]|nr:SMC-Scp complex subunit ScpB [Deltaproteobacteria bacterium]